MVLKGHGVFQACSDSNREKEGSQDKISNTFFVFHLAFATVLEYVDFHEETNFYQLKNKYVVLSNFCNLNKPHNPKLYPTATAERFRRFLRDLNNRYFFIA